MKTNLGTAAAKFDAGLARLASFNGSSSSRVRHLAYRGMEMLGMCSLMGVGVGVGCTP